MQVQMWDKFPGKLTFYLKFLLIFANSIIRKPFKNNYIRTSFKTERVSKFC